LPSAAPLCHVRKNQKLQAVFDSLDADHDGSLSLEEIELWAQDEIFMGNAAFSSRFPSVMELRELDKNGDGTVSVQELGAYFKDVPEEQVDAIFLTLLADREAITAKAVDNIFNLLDRDGTECATLSIP
jgi:Ca2+-binding EF-hand superfamily protein